MKQKFTANVWPEGDGYVAQAIEAGVASQGDTEEEALANLKEALELHYERPGTIPPRVFIVEADIAPIETPAV